MRKVVVCNIVSLDGFYTGPGGDMTVIPFDKGFSEYNLERLRTADSLLLGRTTFEVFRSYWPAIAEDTSQPLVEREIARLNTAMEKIVISNSLKPDKVEGWGPARVVKRAAAHVQVASLKQSPGRDILVFGSHYVWNDLFKAGLVDELHLMIGAGFVGEGLQIFENQPVGRLHLMDSHRFDDSSLLLVKYAVGK